MKTNKAVITLTALLVSAFAQAQDLATLPKCKALVVTGSSTKSKILTLKESNLAFEGEVLHTATDYAIGAKIGNIHFEIQENPSGIFPEISVADEIHTSALALDWNRKESPEKGYLDIRTSIYNSKGIKSTVILSCEKSF